MEFDFEMHLNESGYWQVECGRKKLEGRLFDDKGFGVLGIKLEVLDEK